MPEDNAADDLQQSLVEAVGALLGPLARLAVARGLNPDVPRHLKKVTETT